MIQEQFTRTAMLIGERGVARLCSARVAVFGVGGVGSYAVEALVRSGVGELLLVDADVVELTNLNRQLHATMDTVGKSKVDLMARRAISINPQIRVDTEQVFCLPENIPAILTGHFDYIVDAVDTVSAKLALAEQARARSLPIISAMGAGNKLDPTRFRVADIFETSVCPLCRVMRRELRKRDIPALKVVFSTEPPLEPMGGPGPGSVAFVPSVAGLIVAGEVVRDIIGWPENRE